MKEVHTGLLSYSLKKEGNEVISTALPRSRKELLHLFTLNNHDMHVRTTLFLNKKVESLHQYKLHTNKKKTL